ncbi:hypothetical protein ACFVMC_03000 [Nocardia sp. NPDC127579]|uniref:hypothetical protein n=1 Tax=Nocardia sp. NPDC127579 TaxID=3345402 RepID=UPI003634EFD3
MTNPSAPQPGRPRRFGFLQIALGLFALGLLAIIGIFLTPILTDGSAGLWLYLAAMLAPLGFILGVGYALWSGRRAR